MLNTLIKFLNDENVMERLENACNVLSKRINEELEKYNIDVNGNVEDELFDYSATNFADKDDHYELVVNVHEKVDLEDINVDLRDDKILKVVVNHKEDNMTYKSSTTTMLPEDAVAETLTAELSDGKIVICVEKKKENKKICVNKK